MLVLPPPSTSSQTRELLSSAHTHLGLQCTTALCEKAFLTHSIPLGIESVRFWKYLASMSLILIFLMASSLFLAEVMVLSSLSPPLHVGPAVFHRVEIWRVARAIYNGELIFVQLKGTAS
jgi:hypothetical protein